MFFLAYRYLKSVPLSVKVWNLKLILGKIKFPENTESISRSTMFFMFKYLFYVSDFWFPSGFDLAGYNRGISASHSHNPLLQYSTLWEADPITRLLVS